MSRIIIQFDDHISNVLTYLSDTYHITPEVVVIDALNEFYAEEIKELERKEE